MTILDFLQACLHDSPVGVVVTDTTCDEPGPIILYCNPAFARLTGRDEHEIIGQSPRFMQGKETRREALDVFRRALETGDRYHGYLTNYRRDGTRYRAEIDCRPLRSTDLQIEYFVSFEREVTRRIGRPGPGHAGRYEPVAVSNELLTGLTRAFGLFSHAVSPDQSSQEHPPV